MIIHDVQQRATKLLQFPKVGKFNEKFWSAISPCIADIPLYLEIAVVSSRNSVDFDVKKSCYQITHCRQRSCHIADRIELPPHPEPR